MAFVLPSFVVGALHGFKQLPDDIKYTTIGLTTLGLYAKTLVKHEILARTMTPSQKFGALVCAAPAVTAFTWFTGKNIGKAIRFVSEASISEQEHPSGPQAQA